MKKFFSQIAAVLLFAGLALAEDGLEPIDLSKYPGLTPSQIDLIHRLEKRGIAKETIEDYIKALLKPKDPGPVIPAYQPGDIEAVTKWAVGGAFASFARDARVVFDRDAYMNDCPNLPLFGFGKATSTQFLHADVMQGFVSYVYMLGNHVVDPNRDFQDFYMEEIRKTEFAKYVTIKETL